MFSRALKSGKSFEEFFRIEREEQGKEKENGKERGKEEGDELEEEQEKESEVKPEGMKGEKQETTNAREAPAGSTSVSTTSTKSTISSTAA